MKILKTIHDRLGPRGRTLLLSVATAVLVWYGLQVMTGFGTRITDIPVTVQPPPGWLVLDASTRTVDLDFLGTREDLRLLNRDLVKVTVDLRDHTDTAPFVHTFADTDINAPGMPIMKRASPGQITVRVDRQATKQVPVRLDTQNMLPAGYEQKAPVITPATVQLTGPEKLLATIGTVSTQPIDLDGRIRTFTRRGVRLVPPAGDGSAHIRMEPAAVTLEVPIVERSATVRFEDIPIGLLCPPGQALAASVVPDTAAVTVKGPPELVNSLLASDIRLFADATGVAGGSSAMRAVHADLPDRISLLQSEPAQVRIQLSFGELRAEGEQ